MGAQNPFYWECHPEAESLLVNILEEYCHKNPSIKHFEEDLLKHTSTRIFDWIDHFALEDTPEIESKLEKVGFVHDPVAAASRVFFHPRAQLPKAVLKEGKDSSKGVAVKVESIADFLMVRGASGHVEGDIFSSYRKCSFSKENGVSLWVVERRSGYAAEPAHPGTGFVKKYVEAKEIWQTRPRALEDEQEALAKALLAAKEMVDMLGKDLASWVVLECEREYWQSKNTAGQIQKNRQDRLGMGWANHDHHTFRSSRRHFQKLVELFEVLGFHCRERFYAGEEAGWGAQVMENQRSGLVLFLDLDLSPEELEIDFAHHNLEELKHLGTVGLWCGLHGDSILQSGMHHLEAQFMFDAIAKDLLYHHVKMMDPFSNFPYLKQAFTHGEVWPVDPKRIAKLVENGRITQEEADKFLKYGAVGSHLENLQRREGYKGFNQKNVSCIIKKTDPRKQELS